MRYFGTLALVVVLGVCVMAGCNGQAQNPGESMLVAVRRDAWDADPARGVVLSSENYRIFTTSGNRLLVEYLPGFMEASYRNYLRITGLSGRELSEPMPIYLMGSRDEWVALTRSITGRYAELFLNIEAGGFCYRGVCVFWDIGGLGTLSVSAHEGLHQFFHYRLRNQLPMWLEEGMCVTAEGYEVHGDRVSFTPERNTSRFSNLRNALVQGYWIRIADLLPMDGGDAVSAGLTSRAVGYYGQLWAMLRFLNSREDYRAGFSRLIADAEAGRLHVAMKVPASALAQLRRRGRDYNRTVSEPLFRHYITDDLDTFEREFRAFAEKLVGLAD